MYIYIYMYIYIGVQQLEAVARRHQCHPTRLGIPSLGFAVQYLGV